jgi:hypothetical protein
MIGRYVTHVLALALELALASCLVPPPPGSEAQHTDTSTSKEAEVVIAKLSTLRQEKGLPPPKVLLDIQEMAAEDAVALERGECDGESALHRVLEKTLWKLKRENTVVRAWFFATQRLDEVPFPPELLKTKALRVAVLVARHLPGQSNAFGVVLSAEIPGDSLEVNR